MSATNGKLGYGATLTRGGNAIAEIISLSAPSLSADSVDVTTMDSANGYREFIQGMRDAGEISVEGIFYPGDTNGQMGLISDFNTGLLQTFVLSFPSAMGASWTFTGIVTGFEGDIPMDDKVGFTSTIKISGKPTLAVTASTGLTSPFFVISNSAVITPAASGSVYDYVATVLTGVTSVTVTPTATAGIITVNGNVVNTGVASSAIVLGSAGSVTPITIQVAETNKTAKTYSIKLVRP